MLAHKTRGEGRKPKPKRYSIIEQLKYVLSDLYCSVRTLVTGKNCKHVAVHVDERRITAGQNQNGTASLHNLSHNSNTFY